MSFMLPPRVYVRRLGPGRRTWIRQNLEKFQTFKKMKFGNLYFLFQIFCGYRIILTYLKPETIKNIQEKYFHLKVLQKFYKKACSIKYISSDLAPFNCATGPLRMLVVSWLPHGDSINDLRSITLTAYVSFWWF